MHRAMRRPAVVAQGGGTEQEALRNLSKTNCRFVGIESLCGLHDLSGRTGSVPIAKTLDDSPATRRIAV
jgi:hypothetical protein